MTCIDRRCLGERISVEALVHNVYAAAFQDVAIRARVASCDA
jgi:hypothetical protein